MDVLAMEKTFLDYWQNVVPLAYCPMVKECKDKLLDHIGGCIAIGVSPTDYMLNHDKHCVINNIIRKCFTKRGIPFSLVGEYAPETHRWHYHGFARIKDMNQLDSLKRSMVRQVGRTISSPIRYERSYVDYMLKTYIYPIILNTVQPFKADCISTNMFILNFNV